MAKKGEKLAKQAKPKQAKPKQEKHERVAIPEAQRKTHPWVEERLKAPIAAARETRRRGLMVQEPRRSPADAARRLLKLLENIADLEAEVAGCKLDLTIAWAKDNLTEIDGVRLTESTKLTLDATSVASYLTAEQLAQVRPPVPTFDVAKFLSLVADGGADAALLEKFASADVTVAVVPPKGK